MLNCSIIKLDTLNTSLVFTIYGKNVELTYYGSKLSGTDGFAVDGRNPFESEWGASNDHYFTAKASYSSVGDGNAMEPLVSILNADGSFVNRFGYVKHEMVSGGEEMSALPCAHSADRTLIIEYYDDVADIALKQYYTVFSDCDVIAVRQQLINNGKDCVSVKRLFSLQLEIDGTGYKCVSFHGAWGRERFRKELTVSAGALELQSMTGHSSAMTNPFFMLEKRGVGAYAFNLIYSGNHKELIEAQAFTDNTRVLTGLSDYCLDWILKGGESFESPQAVMLFADSEREVTLQMHEFAMKHIVGRAFADMERPVLLNNWEGTYFNFNEKKLLALAEKAVEIGVELFVLDDGWFGHRDDDTSSLGDWYDNKRKLNGGLGSLADKIRAMGLKFGIWVEPEMISEDSDLFRAHPEYAMAIPGREPIRRRHQLMLDLVNPEVQDYVIKEISDVIERCGAYYVKWDCNRFMSDMYSPTLENPGEYFHRYELGLYRIIKEITQRFPEVLFESCSSGGNRFDLGMLRYMPQAWCSDMTEPGHRVSIQEGTLYAYPQSAIGAHVAAWSNTSFETKFNVACIGAFGYELDVTACSEAELQVMKAQIEYYKEHRHLLQFGRYFRLDSIFGDDGKSSWIIVNDDKSEAIAFLCATKELNNSKPSKWSFTGLDDDAMYSVEMRRQANLKDDFVISGKANGSVLNNGLISFRDLFRGEADRLPCTGTLATRLIYFKKI